MQGAGPRGPTELSVVAGAGLLSDASQQRQSGDGVLLGRLAARPLDASASVRLDSSRLSILILVRTHQKGEFYVIETIPMIRVLKCYT